MENKITKLNKVKGSQEYISQLKSELQELKQAEKREFLHKQRTDLKTEIKKSNKERVLENKNPFFYKKKEIGNMLLAKKLDEMGKNKEKLENYISKKRHETEGKKAGIASRQMEGLKKKKIEKLAKINE